MVHEDLITAKIYHKRNGLRTLPVAAPPRGPVEGRVTPDGPVEGRVAPA